MIEVVQLDLDVYEYFNVFFICVLKLGVCVLDVDFVVLLCLVDGCISQVGDIVDGWIFQVKGQLFIVVEFLGDEVVVVLFCDGCFVMVYLLFCDYYCVYMLLVGMLCEMVYVLGCIFSVVLFVVEVILCLFVCNECFVCYFDGEYGLFVVVLVGVILVLLVFIVWDGLVILFYVFGICCKLFVDCDIQLECFVEMGCFNMGFIVIVLLLLGSVVFDLLVLQQVVKVGQCFGKK